MIKQQAQQAQFIVVSLRRPMIESAERTVSLKREELILKCWGSNVAPPPRPEVLLIVLTN